MQSQEILDEFKKNIRTELDLCDPVKTPYLCANIEDPKAYAKIEALITSKVIAQQLTIGEAIVAIENELNPNAYAD